MKAAWESTGAHLRNFASMEEPEEEDWLHLACPFLTPKPASLSAMRELAGVPLQGKSIGVSDQPPQPFGAPHKGSDSGSLRPESGR